MVRARVYVTLKKSVFDPQGKAILDALRSMGYSSVAEVRQGKFFEIALEGADGARARETVEEIAHRVLSNPVIESCRVEVDPMPAAEASLPPSGIHSRGRDLDEEPERGQE